MKKLKRLNLQLFADLDSIVETNQGAFEDFDIKGNFETIQTKLNELGYDVLINHKEKAEFVPSSRLSEVVQQRDAFKQKVEELNISLANMKAQAGDNEELKKNYQDLIDKNNLLLAELEETRINTEIMLAAKDAINAKDLLVFVNRDNIKINAKGEILGVEAEIERLKAEKPYLFNTQQQTKKAGADNKEGQNDDPAKVSGMNAMIRRAAGRI